MSISYRLFSAIRNQLNRCRYRWYRLVFVWTEQQCHRRLEIGRDVIFFMPVRAAGGSGTLVIGEGNRFGVSRSHRLGSGEFLLRAGPPEAKITIGKNNWFNNNTVLCAVNNISIGNDCRIGDYVAIYDADFHEINPATRNRSAGEAKPVVVGNNVWIGSRAMVLKGVTIGDNSVIAAMSVVNSSIPPNCIAAGIPARVIRRIE